jgi:hypothetical protein
VEVSLHLCGGSRYTSEVRTCDKGSIGVRTSCLRVVSRPGLGPLLGEEVVLELALLCWRLDGGLLECGVLGLAVGIIVSLRCPLHDLFEHGGTWERHACFCSPGPLHPRDRTHQRHGITYHRHSQCSRPSRAGRSFYRTQNWCCCLSLPVGSWPWISLLQHCQGRSK